LNRLQAELKELENARCQNLLPMGRNIGQSALVCQGQTWHSMLRAGGLRWARAFRAGIAHREPEGNRGVKFGVRWPFA
jgi:hypothetical protein